MSPEHRPGVLFAVVGPSGVGKDALMTAAARHPALDHRVRFARRAVTRVALAASEDHDSLDEAGFDQAAAAGAFALTWAAHGLRYALPGSVATEVAEGLTVLANLSRGTLGAAATAFGRLRIVEVTARPDVLFSRLMARGREAEATIRERLEREVQVIVPPAAEGHLLLDNSGDLGASVEVLVRHVNEVTDHRTSLSRLGPIS